MSRRTKASRDINIGDGRFRETLAQIELALEIARLGGRPQMMQSEAPQLSVERTMRIYREVNGASPPKGILPFSVAWLQDASRVVLLQLSLFFVLREQYVAVHGDSIHATLAAYRQMIGTLRACQVTPQLELMRAWFMVRMMSAGELHMQACTTCGSRYAVPVGHNPQFFTTAGECTLCRPRGRTRLKYADSVI